MVVFRIAAYGFSRRPRLPGLAKTTHQSSPREPSAPGSRWIAARKEPSTYGDECTPGLLWSHRWWSLGHGMEASERIVELAATGGFFGWEAVVIWDHWSNVTTSLFSTMASFAVQVGDYCRKNSKVWLIQPP